MNNDTDQIKFIIMDDGKPGEDPPPPITLSPHSFQSLEASVHDGCSRALRREKNQKVYVVVSPNAFVPTGGHVLQIVSDLGAEMLVQDDDLYVIKYGAYIITVCFVGGAGRFFGAPPPIAEEESSSSDEQATNVADGNRGDQRSIFSSSSSDSDYEQYQGGHEMSQTVRQICRGRNNPHRRR